MSKVVNILHLSDIHYSRKKEYDQSLILNALLTDLEKETDGSLKPDLIIISGDLVNNPDEESVYSYFYENVLEPLMKVTKCSSSRIIITPGNHDLHRAYVEDKLAYQKDLQVSLDNRDKLNEVFSRNDLDELFNKKFKEFSFLRDYISSPALKFFGRHASLYEFDELGLAIIEVNSAWMGYGHIEKIDDKGKLLIPEAALLEVLSKVTSGYSKVLVTHHPRNWLAEFSETDLTQTLDGKIDMHLFGHMHEVRPMNGESFKGTCLYNQAGALHALREKYIGYSFIRFETSEKHIEIRYREFFDKRKEFDISSSLCIDGVYQPTPAARAFFRNSEVINFATLQNWQRNTLYPLILKEYNEGLTEKPISDIFVSPPLFTDIKYETPEEEPVDELTQIDISFESVVNSKTNYILYGKAEYGKTTLLQQIALHLLKIEDKSNVSIPVFINFSNIKTNNIEKLLRSNLGDLPDGLKLVSLLKEGLITLLVDDVIFNDSTRYSALRDFINQYPRNRYIFSTLAGRNDQVMVMSDPEMSVNFERIFVKEMRRKDMRSFIAKWDPKKSLNQDKVLDRLLEDLRNINLPLTAVNSTILLSIFESQSSFSPINRFVLIQSFIEVLLDKRSSHEIERKSFDFRNRIHYLAHVAEYMCRIDTYVIPEKDLTTLTLQYLDKFGLLQNAEILISDTLNSRIFQKRPEEKISFRYRAFLEFFVAHQMSESKSFKDWILEEERYLSFVHEISYYASNDRQDSDLIKMISSRFEKINDELFKDLPQINNFQTLESFRLPSKKDSIQLLEDAEDQINAPPLTVEERDRILEADLPQDAENRQEVFRPNPKEWQTKWITCLIIYSNAVRNLELISDDEKREHLTKVLHAWTRLLMASLWSVRLLARKRQAIINGIRYNVIAPHSFSEAQVARSLYCEFPKAVSKMILFSLGTEKLEKQLLSPRLEEADEAKIVKFFRECLCMDLHLHNWTKRFDFLISTLNKNPYLLHATLSKAKEVHAIGTIKDEERKVLRDSLATIVATLRGGSKNQIESTRARHLRKYEIIDNFKKMQLKFEKLDG